MAEKPKRNDPCPCGSGKKYKNCCLNQDQSQGISANLGTVGIVIGIILGIMIVGMVFFGGGGRPDCPPGEVWSEAHGHCH